MKKKKGRCIKCPALKTYRLKKDRHRKYLYCFLLSLPPKTIALTFGGANFFSKKPLFMPFFVSLIYTFMFVFETKKFIN